MLNRTLLIALLACSALQACSPCTTQQKLSCGNYCSERRDCPARGASTPAPIPGVISKIGSCLEQTPRVVMPPPFFTTRTRLANGTLATNPFPHQCQAFDVIWNACNAGSVTSASTSYLVRLQDQVPPGVLGLDQTLSFTAPALAPCACDQKTFVSVTGLHCNEESFTPTTTKLTTSLPSMTVTPATGVFTVGL